MQTLVEESVSRTKPKQKNIVSIVFRKPEYVAETTGGVLFSEIPVPGFLTRVDTSARSFVATLLAGSDEKPVFPKWKYKVVEGVDTKDVVDLVREYVSSLVLEPTQNKPVLPRRSGPLRIPTRLLLLLSTARHVRTVALPNTEGGVDVFTRISSDIGTEYVVFSVQGADKPKIYTYCTCRDSSINEFVVAALAVSAPVLLSALSRDSGSLENRLEYWAKRTEDIATRLGSVEKYAGFAFYLAQFLSKTGLLVQAQPLDENIVLNTVSSLLETGSTTLNTVEFTSRPKMRVRIVWPQEMKEMRERIQGVIKELAKKMGILEEQADWPLLLVFGLVMSSDYNKPPIVLHAVGEIGTFKTTAPRLLSEYLLIPEYVFTYKGPDVTTKYREFLDILVSVFDIPPDLENKVGGIITGLRTTQDTLTISVSIPYLFSIEKGNPDGAAKIRNFLARLKEAGFEVSTRYSRPRIAVLDPAQLSNIEDYRIKYLPDKNLGLLTVMDVFDNHILIIDEGSRNPHGLETLLTKMSISALTEGVRLIIITDNIEPFQEVMSNPRYAPLHDRTFKVMTKSLRNDIAVMENLYKPPSFHLDAVKLLAVQTFIESIPVPDEILYLAKAIGNALEYKYTIVSAKPGEKHLRPIRREERTEIELDVFSGLDFRFVAGGRYMYHTLLLSKFFAFLNGHDHVTMDDFYRALAYTIRSRLVVNAETYTGYKIETFDIIQRAIRSFNEEIINRAIRFTELLQHGDRQEIEEEFANILADANLEPALAPSVMTAIEIALAMKKIDISRLPDSVRYSIIELKLERDDFLGLEPYMDDVSLIVSSRKMVIK